jgi:four helix bundle protein
MTPKELKDRTKRFTVRAIGLCRELPPTLDGRRIGGQLIDSASSVAANYRAACRARSRAEFIVPLTRADALLVEADELTAIFTAAVRTAKGLNRKSADIRSEN